MRERDLSLQDLRGRAAPFAPGAPAIPAVAGGEPGPAYTRHRPEDTVLYQVLAEHWRSYRTFP